MQINRPNRAATHPVLWRRSRSRRVQAHLQQTHGAFVCCCWATHLYKNNTSLYSPISACWSTGGWTDGQGAPMLRGNNHHTPESHLGSSVWLQVCWTCNHSTMWAAHWVHALITDAGSSQLKPNCSSGSVGLHGGEEYTLLTRQEQAKFIMWRAESRSGCLGGGGCAAARHEVCCWIMDQSKSQPKLYIEVST